MTLGIIDVGTNSVHLLLADLRPGSAARVMRHDRQLTRLGEGGLAAKRLAPAAMRRTIAVLRGYATTLKRADVDRVEAVATSAVRDARNGRAFVRRVRRQLGLPLRIISGREEARLIYHGVTSTFRGHGPVLLVAIGGGSAQVIHGCGWHVRYAKSVPLGATRLAQRFIHHDPPTPREVSALARHATRIWKPVVGAVRRGQWRAALGSSAMLSQLMIAVHVRRHGRLPQRNTPMTLTRRSLQHAVSWLSTSTAKERRRLPGIEPKREALLLPTAIALSVWMEGCGVSTVRHAAGSLREGLIAQFRDVLD